MADAAGGESRRRRRAHGVAGVGVSFAVTAGGGSINADVGHDRRRRRRVAGAMDDGFCRRVECGHGNRARRFTAARVRRCRLRQRRRDGLRDHAVLSHDDDRVAATGIRRAPPRGGARSSRTILPDITADFSGVCGGTVPSFNGTVDDLLIFATVEPIDGPANIVGSAGPCIIRTTDSLPIIGTMRFDVADSSTLDNRGLLNSVILHEMGHVLGIGTAVVDRRACSSKSIVGDVVARHVLQRSEWHRGLRRDRWQRPTPAATKCRSRTSVEPARSTATGVRAFWSNELMTGTINNGPPATRSACSRFARCRTLATR